MKQRNPSLGAASVGLAAIMFGLNASTVKTILGTGISPEHLVLFRTTFTALIAGIVLLISNPKGFKVTLKELPLLILFGIVGVALMQWSYSNAVSLLPISVALLIEYTAIAIVPVISFLYFKEKIKPWLWAGIVLILAGLAIVSNIWDSKLNPTGIAWATMAAMCLSVYFIIGEHTQRKRDAMSTLFYTFLIAAIFWLVMNLIRPSEFGDISQSISLNGNLAAIEWPIWASLLWLGIMGSFVPMWLDYIALGNLSATAVGIIATAETVFASVFAWAWLNEAMTPIEIFGGFVVIAGIVLAETSRNSSKV